MTKNKSATRYASQAQEERVSALLGGRRNSNSGAGHFDKSDVVVDRASLSVECKTCMTPKDSFSIKKEWLKKSKEEAFANRLENHAIAFNFFFEDKEDYYIINSNLMSFLVEKLSEEYS